ncbi:MAG TPA: hypothetical protein DEB74_06010 [Lachnospiraceae bacterium]|nr:hypothetical protein [Lachnospiraceae bacterium]
MPYGVPEFPSTNVYHDDLAQLVGLYKKLYDAIKQMEADIKDLQEKWETIDDKIKEELDKAIAGFIAEINAKMAELEQRIMAEMDALRDEVNTNISVMQGDIDKIKTDITAINTSITTISTSITEINNKLAELEAEAGESTADITQIKQNIEDIRNEIANIPTVDAYTKAESDAKYATIAALNSLGNEVDALDARTESVENDVAEILAKRYLQASDVWEGTNNFKFGVDADGNYGYYKAGADTVTPFKTGGGDIYISQNRITIHGVGGTVIKGVKVTNNNNFTVKLQISLIGTFSMLYASVGAAPVNYATIESDYESSVFVGMLTRTYAYPTSGQCKAIFSPTSSGSKFPINDIYPILNSGESFYWKLSPVSTDYPVGFFEKNLYFFVRSLSTNADAGKNIIVEGIS